MTQTETTLTTAPVLHPTTRLGPVHYTAANAERLAAFYRDVLGFQIHGQEGDTVRLGAGGEDLLRLTEVPNARPSRRTTGLYHTAFLVPNRWELANLLRRIAETRTPIQGMSDHGTHHAIYLPDAEGNGIELAWDRPQNMWPKTLNEMLAHNQGLAPEVVFSTLTEREEKWTQLDAGTQVGHVHLHVSELPPTRHFYNEVLGFGLPFDFANPAPSAFADTAIFFAAGSYHHHLGTNIWQGEGAPPPPPNASGLRHYTIVLPDADEVNRVAERVRADGVDITAIEDGWLTHDPSRNGIRLVTPQHV
jgi:catechol 2,3-dioxygenase